MNARVAWALLALGLWGPVWARLAEWWSSDPAHSHGWLVPVFALWLGWARWADAPAPAPPGGGSRGVAGLVAGLAAGGFFFAWVAGLLLLTPNAFWPTAQWVAGLGAAGVWLAVAARAGGARWAGHFAGAALFPLCALAWPTAVEKPLLEHLGPWIASGATELVNAGGRLALAQGAVIEVTNGWVGVDDACVGLRSLDAAVLMAFFMGEQRRFSWRRRLLLGGAALALAVAGNFVRATALVWVAAGEGAAAVAGWHDGAGLTVMLTTLLGVCATASWLERGSHAGDDARPGAETPSPPRVAARPAWLGLGVAGLGWVAVTSWYGWPAGGASTVGWSLASPAPGDWKAAPAPAGVTTILRASRWQGLAGSGEGWQSLAYLIAWEGDRAAGEGAFIHGPEICLPAIGMTRGQEIGVVEVVVAGRRLPLTGARYTGAGGALQYVWFARWDEALGRAVGRGPNLASPTATRLEGVRLRRRGATIAQVGLILAGPADDDAARAWAARWAPIMLTRTE